jgi:dTDP-4-dehydrorhamnose reductase
VCYNANVLLPLQIARACSISGVRYHHVSSGCIYDDLECTNKLGVTKYYTEACTPNFDFISNNSSFYSGTKSVAEQLILSEKSCKNIWRLRIPFESKASTKNYITKLINYDTLLNAVNSITEINQFVSTCCRIMREQEDNPFFGVENNAGDKIWNIVQPSFITTSEVVKLLEKYGLKEPGTTKYFTSLEEFNKVIKAPRSNCVLSTDKLARWKIILPNAITSMEAAIKQYEH